MTNETNEINKANNTVHAFFDGFDLGARMGSCITGLFTGSQTYLTLLLNRHQRAVQSSLHHPIPPLFAGIGAGFVAGGLSFFAMNSAKNSAINEIRNTRVISYESDEHNVDNTPAPQYNR